MMTLLLLCSSIAAMAWLGAALRRTYRERRKTGGRGANQRFALHGVVPMIALVAGCGGGGDPPPTLPEPAAQISLFAGSLQRVGSRDGVGSAAQFNSPEGVVQDAAGNVFVADTANHTVRKIAPDGTVTTLAGTAGVAGSADGTGTGARFSSPRGIGADMSGNLYVADTGNHTVRRVTPDGTVTTLAGVPGEPGTADSATAGAARFNSPTDLAVDRGGNVYVAEHSAVRRIAPDRAVTTFAGVAGQPGTGAGDAAAARFTGISGLAVDGTGSVWVAESVDGLFGTARGRLRRFSGAGQALPLGGAAAGVLDIPFASGIAADAEGNVYIASGGTVAFSSSVSNLSSSVSRVSPDGTLTFIAGNDSEVGSADGPGGAARFRRPAGIAVGSGGSLFVADKMNAAIRRIDAQGVVSTVAGGTGNGLTDGPAHTARFFIPSGLAAAPDGSIYVADSFNGRIRRIDASGHVTTVNVTNEDGTPGTFAFPQEVLLNTDGGFFVAEARTRFSDTVSLVDASGRRRTVEGRGSSAIAVDAAGNLYRSQGDVVTLTEPNGVTRVFASGFRSAESIAIDPDSGTVSVADLHEGYIGTYDASGNLLRTIGRPGESGWRDGTAGEALFDGPSVIAFDPFGNLYVADNSNTIRKVTRDGIVSTIVGIAGTRGVQPGGVNAPLGRVSGLAWSRGALYATVENAVLRIAPVP